MTRDDWEPLVSAGLRTLYTILASSCWKLKPLGNRHSYLAVASKHLPNACTYCRLQGFHGWHLPSRYLWPLPVGILRLAHLPTTLSEDKLRKGAQRVGNSRDITAGRSGQQASLAVLEIPSDLELLRLLTPVERVTGRTCRYQHRVDVSGWLQKRSANKYGTGASQRAGAVQQKQKAEARCSRFATAMNKSSK